MPSLHALLVIALFGWLQDPAPRADCDEWRQCRQLAMEVAQRQEYETFHDLAWRAIQTGPKNDADLMYQLARAQSLSGRPTDALVMLGRLADMGIATDAATSDDFRRVRTLPDWPRLEERIAAVPRASKPSPTIEASSADPGVGSMAVRKTDAAVTPATAGTVPAARIAAVPRASKPSRTIETSSPASGVGSMAVRKTGPAGNVATTGTVPPTSREGGPDTRFPPAPDASEALRFTAPGSTAIGLAYDAVSRRFVIAEPVARKLTVVDEFSQHVATLSGEQAAFAEIGAIEIDPREGNLWVVSSEPAGSAPATTLHKLQLVSGRVLAAFALPARYAPGHFIDVAVTPESTVLALDDARSRLFRLRPGAHVLELVASLDVTGPSSIAPGEGAVAYVVHANGVTRVDLATGAAAPMQASRDVDLTGMGRLRWHRGALVGLQQSGDTCRAVRLALDRRGRTVTAVDILESPASAGDLSTATIVGDVLYYLAHAGDGDMTVRKVRLH